MIPYFTTSDDERIMLAHDGYGIWSGSSEAIIKTFPRTIGGIIKSSNIVSKNVTAVCYLVPPENISRTRLEYFFNQLNEKLAESPGTLELSGNTFEEAYPVSTNFDFKIVDNYVTYTIDFLLGDQDDNGVIEQLSVPDLLNFTRGRKLTFQTEMPDGSDRTFNFWHNADSVRNLNMNVAIKNSGRDGLDGKIIKSGGFESIECECWFLTNSKISRQTIEAYLFNMINGPLGRVGTLEFASPDDGTWNNCFLSAVSMRDLNFQGAAYTLTFISPLQC